MTSLRLGTRGSQLALAQARLVADRIQQISGVSCETVVIRTTGDQMEGPISEGGGKRLFVKELEEALADGTVDLAVHSAKDLPADLPAGLEIAAFLPREDPRDTLVLPAGHRAAGLGFDVVVCQLGQSPRVGTGSVRRTAQLRRVWPSASFSPIRGNLDTRLRKLDHGEYDVLVLAVAGLKRLGAADRISSPLPARLCVPAPGQGAIAIEIRADDDGVRRYVEPAGDRATGTLVGLERALVSALDAGCQAPLGALASEVEGEVELQGVVSSLSGDRVVRRHARAPWSDVGRLAAQVSQDMLADGARALLDEARSAVVDRPMQERR